MNIRCQAPDVTTDLVHRCPFQYRWGHAPADVGRFQLWNLAPKRLSELQESLVHVRMTTRPDIKYRQLHIDTRRIPSSPAISISQTSLDIAARLPIPFANAQQPTVGWPRFLRSVLSVFCVPKSAGTPQRPVCVQ